MEALEDRVVPSLTDGTLLVGTSAAPFASENQSAFATGLLGLGPSTPAPALLAGGGAQLIPTTTTVSSSLNPAGFGQPVTFTATITTQSPGAGTPTGTVQFAIDGTDAGSPVNVSTTGGVTTASFRTFLALLGTHTVTASYSGDASFAASSGSLTQVISFRNNTTTTTVSSSLNPSIIGQTVTFTATVTAADPSAGAPTGTVQFVIDGANAGSPVSLTTTGGMSTASFSTASLTAGAHFVLAFYSGNGIFGSSIGFLAGLQIVKTAATSTQVTSSLNPSAPGQSVTFTATISVLGSATVTPTGTVQFVVDGSLAAIASLSPAGGGLFTASYTTSSLATGTHTVTANYSGDANFAGSSGTLAGGQIVGSGSPISGGGGSGGNVIATLNPGIGVLTLIGYNENDVLTLTQSSPGTLQVAGIGTLINQSSSPVNYALSSIREIDLSLLNGNDSVAMNNFSIPGTISILAGSGSDTLALGSVTAGLIRISVTGPGKSSISLNNTTAATINIAAGDNATLSLSGVNNMGAVMLTAAKNATVSVIGLTTSGDLNITMGDNAQSVTVKNSSANNLTILQTGTTGNPSFDLENDTINNDLNLTAGDGNNTLVLSHLNVAIRMFVTLGAGKNSVSADHVTALFGSIDGGRGGNNTYVDGGGNSGFAVFDFIGR